MATTSIVDFLNSQGSPSDYNSRAALAAKMGISNYQGTASQNTQLLSMLQSTPAPRTVDVSTPVTPSTGSNGSFEVPKIAPTLTFQEPNLSGTVESARQQIANGSLDPITAWKQIEASVPPPKSGEPIDMNAWKSFLANTRVSLYAPLTTNVGGKIGNLNPDGSISQKSTTVNQSNTSVGSGSTATKTSYDTPTAYTVKSGDTLSKIASDNGMTLQQVLQLNPSLQANPNLIKPGQAITLSAKTTAATPTSDYAPGAPTAPGSGAIPSGIYDSTIKTNPFLSDLLKDPATKNMYDSLPADLQGIFLQTAGALGKMVESGKVVNPDIELTPEQNAKLLAQAHSELDPYYQEKLNFLKGDLTKSTSRLMEDYNKGLSREGDNFKQTLDTQAENEAGQGTAFSSGRVNREKRTVNLEQNKLDDALTQATRSGQDTATAFEKNAGSNNLRSLDIPSISSYTASTTGLNQTGGRSLYSPLGTSTLGDLSKEQTTAEAARKSQLETAFRSNRLLDLSTLS